MTLLLALPSLVLVPGAAWAGTTDPRRVGAPDPERWTWPLTPRPEIIRTFDPPDRPWGSGHRGVDLAGVEDQEVRAAGAGVVTYTGVLAGRGVVTVTHGSLRTTYEPVSPSVTVGTPVASGAPLGRLTSRQSHCVPRVCLHWGLRRGSHYLDPLTLLSAGPPRLLPLDGPAGSVKVDLEIGQAAPVAPFPGNVPLLGVAAPPGIPLTVTAAPSAIAPVAAASPGELITAASVRGQPSRAEIDQALTATPARAGATEPTKGPDTAAGSFVGAEGQVVLAAFNAFAAPAAGAIAGATAAGVMVRLSRRTSGPSRGPRPPSPDPPRPAGPATSAERGVVELDAARRRHRRVA
ncbi:murein hydrolase activator EnvC family protein [Actinopolymorpha alba]|uniref:murein hydrolase activator EnvC family protein n=1 Tax=Actinopolymorpha alba TaxID=533267 RepID=UPI000381CE03|nr:M23 family metallopeptidase [Actinopolymorpha alba]